MGMVMILASLVNGIHCFVYFIHNKFIYSYIQHTYISILDSIYRQTSVNFLFWSCHFIGCFPIIKIVFCCIHAKKYCDGNSQLVDCSLTFINLSTKKPQQFIISDLIVVEFQSVKSCIMNNSEDSIQIRFSLLKEIKYHIGIKLLFELQQIFKVFWFACLGLMV